MPKRLTDTDIWKTQRWFRKISPIYKLAFCYIKDQCDHAGVWKIDCSDLIEDLGLDSFDLQSFISAVNIEYDKITGDKIIKERVRIVDKNKLWVIGFVQFQYQNKSGVISQEAAPVKTALEILEGLGVLAEGLKKGYLVLSNSEQPLPKEPARAKDKDKDKDKDKAKKKIGGTGGKIGFNTMPVASDFNGLPEPYIHQSIQFVKITRQADITPEVVLKFWEGFKLQELTGSNHYQNEGRVYSHFLNIIKKQNFSNGNSGKAAGRNHGKTIDFDKP